MSEKKNKLSLTDLERRLWEAAHIITGPIDASDYKTYIFPILFFKRVCDVYDEEFAEAMEFYDDEEIAMAPERHRIQVPKGYHWKDVIGAEENVGRVLQAAFLAIEKTNGRLHGIFGDAPWTDRERFPDHLLLQLLRHFDKINIGVQKVRDDDMGRAYEYLIKRFADKANKKAGEFYTPRSIVRLMVNVLDPRPGETVYDPACGTGGMLLETVHHVKEGGGDPHLLRLKGQEKNLTTEAIARMNLYLHSMEDFEIRRGDTLRDPKFLVSGHLEEFDCVIANPPFSLREWGYEKWSSDPYDRHVFGFAPKTNGDFAWVMHMYSSMKKNGGRMAVVLPHGVLFRSGAEGKIRKKLLDIGAIKAVIGLAGNLFYGTSIPASILVLHKKCKARAPVLFINAERIYTKGRAQNTMTSEQADEIYSIYLRQHRQAFEEEGFSRWVDYSELKENNFNLNIARYVQMPLEEEKITIKEALRDFKLKQAGLEIAEKELESLFKREGFEL